MRQAGRSLPEYRRVREGTAMLESCFTPDLVVEITDQPVRRHGVDAAIFFSDIVVPLKAIGVDLDIVPGVGPVVADPIRDAAGVAGLRDLVEADVAPVLEAVRILTSGSGPLGATPLIGFAGAPFTLASYLIEGGPSRDHARTKALMYSDPGLWNDLADRLARIAGGFLRMQALAGASALQLFDSWAGALPAADYEALVLPHVRTALSAVDDLSAAHGIPRIVFGVGTGELLATMSRAGSEVMGVDFRVPLDQAAQRVRPGAALQGNLDPAVVRASEAVVQQRVDAVLAAARRSGRGHIFNLGHGVLPDTDPEVLTRIVERVHAAGPVPAVAANERVGSHA
jgi:uroporphyrinogen decarboxylase